MIDEGIVLIGAGSHTTAWVLAIAIFHILSNPTILRNLKEEFSKNKKNEQNLSLYKFEKPPYSLLSPKKDFVWPVVRLSRSPPDTALRFKDWVIPKGIPVSMTSIVQHQNEAIPPDSWFFKRRDS